MNSPENYHETSKSPRLKRKTPHLPSTSMFCRFKRYEFSLACGDFIPPLHATVASPTKTLTAYLDGGLRVFDVGKAWVGVAEWIGHPQIHYTIPSAPNPVRLMCQNCRWCIREYHGTWKKSSHVSLIFWWYMSRELYHTLIIWDLIFGLFLVFVGRDLWMKVSVWGISNEHFMVGDIILDGYGILKKTRCCYDCSDVL